MDLCPNLYSLGKWKRSTSNNRCSQKPAVRRRRAFLQDIIEPLILGQLLLFANLWKVQPFLFFFLFFFFQIRSFVSSSFLVKVHSKWVSEWMNEWINQSINHPFNGCWKKNSASETRHISSSIANLTAQLVLYQNKIHWTKHQRTRLCVTVGMRLKYKAYHLTCIINNSLAFRYVTSQIWKYYVIFGFVPNERGRIHEHKAPFRKQLSAQAFKVYSFISLCERRVQNQHMVTVWGALFSSAQLTAFAVHLLAVIKQRCNTAGAPFWIGGELPVFVVRPHALNWEVCTVTVQYEYMYHATPNIYTILPKVLGRPLLMNRFDYFSNFYEYKS